MRATVVIKAEFTFGDGILTQVQAQPVRPDTEMAFVLRRAEVLFAGLSPSHGAQARLSVWRGSDELLGLDAVVTGGEASPLGRLSPFAPERSVYLGGFSPVDCHQRFVELPDSFDSTFFQSAPPAQQLTDLAGGDTVVLDDLYPGHRRLMLRLPTAHASGIGRMDARSAPIRFTLDTLLIDAMSHRCTLLWRGRVAASTPEALASTRAFAELTVTDAGDVKGDMPPPWVSHAAPRAVHPVVTDGSPPSFLGTVNLGATAMRAATSSPATPFARSSESPAPVTPRPEIPGAPWANAPSSPAVVLSPEGITETVGLQELAARAANQPGDLKLPKGIRRPKSAPEPKFDDAPQMPAIVVPPSEPEQRQALDGAEAKPPEVVAPSADEQRRAAAEAEAQRLELERKSQEMAAAEERRRQDAERFAAEQRAAEQAAQERVAQEAAERKKARSQVKTAMYGRFKKK